MGMTFDISALTSGLASAKADMITKSEEIISTLADQFVNNARDNLVMNGSVQTWNLYNSMDKDVQTQGDGMWTAIVGPAEASFMDGVQYGIFVEYGRGEIRPVTKQALHFFVAGKEVFARYAKAAPPKPFMMPALAATSEEAADIITFILAM